MSLYTETESTFYVLIYYHHDGDDASLHGWWFGPDTMEFGTEHNWAFNPEESGTPPLSGWHVPWNGPVDPAFKVTEVEEVPMDIVRMNRSFPPPPPLEVPLCCQDPVHVPTDGAPLPPERTLPITAAASALRNDLSAEQAREVIKDQAQMISAAVKQLSSGKNLADLVFGIDTKMIPREPPSDEFIAKLAEERKCPAVLPRNFSREWAGSGDGEEGAQQTCGLKGNSKSHGQFSNHAVMPLPFLSITKQPKVTVLEEAVRRLESGEAFADEMFGRHMSDKWSDEAETNFTQGSAEAQPEAAAEPPADAPAAAPADAAAVTGKNESQPAVGAVDKAEGWEMGFEIPLSELGEGGVWSFTFICSPCGLPLSGARAVANEVATAANTAAEKARRWKDAEIAEDRAKKEAEQAKKDVEKMTVQAAKEEAEKAIEQAADEEAREAKEEASKEAETAQGEAKAKATKVAAAKKKLEELKGQVPKEAKDAADKALHNAVEHAQMKEEKVHEARFALEDLGSEAPPEVKEAAEEALSKAEEEADAAKTEVEEARHTLDAMKTTVTPEQRDAAEKELAQAEEEAKQADDKAKDAAKKAGDIKLTSHDPAADNVLYTDSKVKEDKGGAVVMGSEPQTDTEKDLQEQLSALQSKLTGLERLQIKDKLDDELKEKASLRQADVEPRSAAIP
ncbi:unnamed protein product [Symbiodinium natans]|uniref:Uncharacterized protein n=1 Tax=Symbiodinium natans TaxID=878477 RepID=A0A812IME7_9DINO|nr:unnamed protein product [Symbiodinium natans]